ncbi:glycosyl hydrolase 115 family protein [Niabella yanshanensis]|uniref:Glycosyl hydrolase 115 family protein n=1 Tax=Niabella yanshanensis TaxID=577386 RepID=A0ABZ0W7X8_9BACT|nr:glycosyl hydrolase 115 family protein [Niabella yanshanensis]WQD38713.1 glycosyl hydrolase 115 family protein [Niabella yanshanensis]
MKRSFLTIIAIILCLVIKAQHFISEKNNGAGFPVVSTSKATSIYVDPADDKLVHKAAALLQKDIEAITGQKPDIISSLSEKRVIIIGSLPGSATIKNLANKKKINIGNIRGQWEAFSLQTVIKPVAGVESALVIVGSDRRGTAYGIFELSEQLGVSPWYWWADVPVKKKPAAYFINGLYHYPSPSVKYRGIFINDEEPAFGGWAREKFGGINSKMYEHLFELILRLKGNYLWPAMWGKAFNEDDKENPRLADEYGIVMGTSHHEPMMRAQKEWGSHRKEYGNAAWNYHTNKEGLQRFWEDGFRRNQYFDNMVTIGMRGDGDEAMHDMGSMKANYEQLEGIIKDQRNIIEKVSGKPAKETPQMWALYKEVQEYYDMGMKVPDDVTLLLCDDNWGNIRRLPAVNAAKRSGGYGIYYHFDYVGGPRSYRWLNTNNIARVWEQMNLAYDHGVDKIWIVNVGDLKPMELPTSFFLEFAWDVKKWNAGNIDNYYTQWAGKQFGNTWATQIGKIMKKYAVYASRRKPELLEAKTYSIENYDEANRIANEWNSLLKEAQALNEKMPATHKDAFYELVLHPVKAYGNLQNMYIALAWNQYYAKQNNSLANRYANEVKELYIQDSLINAEYHQLNDGKWNHMMAQKRIGYTSWSEPRVQKMPQVSYVENPVSAEPASFTQASKTSVSLIPATAKGNLFYEKDGYVAINAAHYTRKKDIGNSKWKPIAGIAREGDAVTLFPDLSKANLTGITQAPYLEYEVYTSGKDDVEVQVLLSPSLNFKNTKTGLQYAIQVNDDTPQPVSINPEAVDSRAWSQWVTNNINTKITKHRLANPGKQIIRIYTQDPGVVIQKIIMNMGGLKPSYLGPQETLLKK